MSNAQFTQSPRLQSSEVGTWNKRKLIRTLAQGIKKMESNSFNTNKHNQT